MHRSSLFVLSFLIFAASTSHGSKSDVYNNFCGLFGNTSVLQTYDIDQISSKILNQVNCSKNPTLDCMNCLSSRKLKSANLISDSITANDLGRVSLVIYCYLNDLNQFCRAGSNPDYQKCLNYLTNGTEAIDESMLSTSLGNRIAPIYKVPNEYHPIKGISWDASCLDGKHLILKHKNKENQVQGSERLNDLFADIVYMMYNKIKLGCDLPASNWFIDQLFTKNGVIVDSITVQDLSNIMTQMGIQSPQMAGRSLPIKNSLQYLVFTHQLSLKNSSSRKTAVRNSNILNVYNMNYSQCYTPNEIVEIFSLMPNSITQMDFGKIAPSLVYLASRGVCASLQPFTAPNQDQTDEPKTTTTATPAQKYGYGTIAIVIVSLLALLGIVLIPCFGKAMYPKILMVLTALAVGTLLSDAMLHLIPDILDVETEDSPQMYIPQYAVQISVAIGAIWIFWVIETVIHHFAHIERVVSHSHGGIGNDHDHDHEQYHDQSEIKDNTISGSLNLDGIATPPASDSDHQLTQVTINRGSKLRQTLKFGKMDIKKIRATGWILLLGDAIHNFADGLAIGASFAVSVSMGIATTIAVVCHEVPHELGNYAVLVKSGFNHCQALLLNLCSATTCLIGFYIGASVSTDPLVSKWIFTITAGMFLYLSLVDLLPQVMHGIKWSWGIFIACNLAMMFGYGVMLMLVVVEDHIIL